MAFTDQGLAHQQLSEFGEPGAVRPRILGQPVRGLMAPGSPKPNQQFTTVIDEPIPIARIRNDR